MVMMERRYQDRALTPTVIDLSQDDEVNDPTYSPRPLKKEKAVSPQKSLSSRKLSTQTTLHSFLLSPTKKLKQQTTIDAFIKQDQLHPGSHPRSTHRPPSPVEAPLPSAFEYDSTGEETLAHDEPQQLRSAIEASTVNSQQGQNAKHSFDAQNPSDGRQLSTVGPEFDHGGPTVAGSSKYRNIHKADRTQDLVFSGGSQSSTARTTPFPQILPLIPEGNTRSSPTSPNAQLKKLESSSKRKYSDIAQDDVCVLGLQVRTSLPEPPPAVNPTAVFDRKAINLRDFGQKPNTQDAEIQTIGKTNAGNQQGSSALRSKQKIQMSHSRSNNQSFLEPIVISSDDDDGNDHDDEDYDHDEFFTVYDPFDDVEELRSLQKRVEVSMPEQKPVHLGETPIEADRDDHMAARGISLASRLLERGQVDGHRRPYLSSRARKFLSHTGCWEGYRNYEGQLIHCSFTAMEARILRTSITKFTGLEGPKHCSDVEYIAYARNQLLSCGETSLQSCMRSASKHLSGRNTNDCISFAEDCVTGDIRPRDYLIVSSSNQPVIPSTRQMLRFRRELGWSIDRCSVASEGCRQIQHSIINDLEPWKVFKEGSSDILDLAWSPFGDTFALGTATLNDEYNRPGNLILGSVALSRTRMLHGHQLIRPEPIGAQDPVIHSTVSRVGFSSAGLLYSGGYDSTVRVWHPNSGTQLYCLKMPDRVESLSVSPYHSNVVAVGCRNGTLELSYWSEEGSLESRHTCMPSKPPLESLFPACLTWAGQFLIAGYDNPEGNTSAGNLVIYNAETGTQFTKVVPGSTRHFDLFFHPSGSFVTACLARNPKAGVKSNVRKFNFSSTGATCEFDLDSPQLDINRVTLSPCGTFVTASGTDGSTICWDTRWPEQILHRLEHGPPILDLNENAIREDEDTGVEVALWSDSSDYLYTGGSDGIIKIWDIKRADPFVKDLGRVNAQIMSGQFSPGKDMLLIGDTSGSATLFSTRGDRNERPMVFTTEGGVIPGPQRRTEADVPDEELGRYYARRLIQEGRVILAPDGSGAYGA